MIQPIKNRVLLQPTVEKRVGGILIPENSQKRSREAVVVKVGPECQPEVKKAKKVLIDQYAGIKITDKGVEYVLVSEEELMAIIED